MKVLITGASGFVGRHLAHDLVRNGYDVRAVARHSSDVTSLEKLGVEIVRGNIQDAQATLRAVKGCRRVYHLAGQMRAPGTPRKQYFSVNVEGTKSIARACATVDLDRLVHVSTTGVYGIIRTSRVDEDSPVRPLCAYWESKLLAEKVVRSELTEKGLPAVIIRLPDLMGPGATNWLGLARAIATGRFRIIGSGNNHNQIAGFRDAVEALRLCGETNGIDGQCYVVSGKDTVTVREIIATIAREIGVPVPRTHLPIGPYRAFNRAGEILYKTFGYELPGLHHYVLFLSNKVFDTSRAQRDLGFSPKVSFAEEIKRTVDWYRSTNLLEG